MYNSFPVAVSLNLFFIPLWVFIFVLGICFYPEKIHQIAAHNHTACRERMEKYTLFAQAGQPP
jgi:hypothetical protein